MTHKSTILSFLLTYITPPLIIHLLPRLITIIKLGHPSQIPLTETNPRIQTGHHSRIPLAEVNHQIQPGHPPMMLLAEAD